MTDQEGQTLGKNQRPRFYTAGRITVYTLVFLFLASYYYWQCAREWGDPWHCWNIFSHERWGPYGDLTVSFENHSVSILFPPDPKLALASNPYDPATRLKDTQIMWDYSYYKGKYYLYFGPVPALLFCCPWDYLTGGKPSENLVMFVPCLASLILFFVLLRTLVTRYFPRVPIWLECFLFILYAFTNLLPYMSGRPGMYEIALGFGAAFTLCFFVIMLQAVHTERRRWVWLMLASLCAGLAIGSRPTTMFLYGILGFYGIFLHRNLKLTATFFKDLAAIAIPAAISAAALLWYNYARYQNPFTFGHEMALNNGEVIFTPQFELRNIFDGIWSYYFMPWRIVPDFPWVGMVTLDAHLPWIYLPERGRQEYTGLLVSCPVVLMGFVWFWYARKLPAAEKSPVMIFGALISGWWILVTSLFCTFAAIVGRYEVELQLPLLIMTSLTLLARRNLGPFHLWERGVLFVLFVYSCYFGFAWGLISEDYWIQEVMQRYHHLSGQ